MPALFLSALFLLALLPLLLIPRPVERLQSGLGERDPEFLRPYLDAPEPPRELRVRLVQRHRRMDPRLAAQVHHREQQVANLPLESRRRRFMAVVAGAVADAVSASALLARAAVGAVLAGAVPGVPKLLTHFIQLLVHLRDRPGRIRPIETDARGAILQSKCTVQCRQADRQSVHDALALPGLHGFPRLARHA